MIQRKKKENAIMSFLRFFWEGEEASDYILMQDMTSPYNGSGYLQAHNQSVVMKDDIQ